MIDKSVSTWLSSDDIVAVRRALHEVSNRARTYRSVGICFLFLANYSGTDAGTRWLSETMQRWPLYSGAEEYPVPGGKIAYDEAVNTQTTWSVQHDGDYASLRWSVCGSSCPSR